MSLVDLLIKDGNVYTESGFQDLDVGVIGEKDTHTEQFHIARGLGRRAGNRRQHGHTKYRNTR